MNIPLDQQTVISFPSDQDATGRTLGEEELRAITEALQSGTLTVTKGAYGKRFEQAFAELYQVPFATACSSGSAAIHAAVAAINPEPGDEIITTSITDMGALTPILYQGAIPVFADVDPRTGNVTKETIEARYSSKTRGVIVTHLFGNPCDMRSIMAWADQKNLPVIEDTAQAFLAAHHGQWVGTWGTLGCFSLQQGKHITTGEGGIVVSRQTELARRSYLFINKSWGYGDPQPDHYFIGLNYRYSELQAACAWAQLQKLPAIVEKRVSLAATMDELLQDIPGLSVPLRQSFDRHSYWKYSLLIDPQIIPGGPAAVGKKLREVGILSAPRYIQKPAFRCQIFAEQKTFGTSGWPFSLASPEATDYSAERFPGTFQYLDQVLVLPWNENYSNDHLHYLAQNLRESIAALTSR